MGPETLKKNGPQLRKRKTIILFSLFIKTVNLKTSNCKIKKKLYQFCKK